MDWSKIQSLSEESQVQILSMYLASDIPIEVRSHFAKFIEDNVSNLNPDDDNNVQGINAFWQTFIELLEARASAHVDAFYVRRSLLETASKFRAHLANDAIAFFKVLREYRRHEIRLIELELGQIVPQEQDEIVESLIKADKVVAESTNILRKIHHDKETLSLLFNRRKVCDAVIQELSRNPTGNHFNEAEFVRKRTALDQQLNENVSAIVQHLQEFQAKVIIAVDTLHQTQNKVIEDHIITWKYEKQLAATGVKITTSACHSLDQIQEHCEKLAILIWSLKQQVQEVVRFIELNPVIQNAFESHQYSYNMTTMHTSIISLLANLLNEAFIVEKQPPQAMKLMGQKFQLGVRHLVGNKLQFSLSLPLVTTKIVSEASYKSFYEARKSSPHTLQSFWSVVESGHISNGIDTMRFNEKQNKMAATFSNVQLAKIIREDKKQPGKEYVTEEKLCLLFESEVTIADQTFKIATASPPVVNLTHTKHQIVKAEATIFWDNSFGPKGRFPFDVPQSASWAEISCRLNAKWTMETGRELSQENLIYLKHKAFKGRIADDEENLTWLELCRQERSEAEQPTFWESYYEALKSITSDKLGLKRAWKEGHIMGFIGREEAEELLKNSIPGTFLIRFSDSLPGAIALVLVQENGHVLSVGPLASRELSYANLPNTIHELKELMYLYPSNLPKEKVFKDDKDASITSSTTASPSTKKINPYSELKRMIVANGTQAKKMNSIVATNETQANSDKGFGLIGSEYNNTSQTSCGGANFDDSIMQEIYNMTINGTVTDGIDQDDLLEEYEELFQRPTLVDNAMDDDENIGLDDIIRVTFSTEL